MDTVQHIQSEQVPTSTYFVPLPLDSLYEQGVAI